MAFLFCDSFDHYSTTQLLQKWTNYASAAPKITASVGRNSSQALEFDSTYSIQKVLVSSGNTFIIGFAKKPSSGGGANGFFQLTDATVTHITIGVNGDGTWWVKRGTSIGTLLGNTTAVQSSGTYDYWEIKIVIDDTTGSVTIRKNGSTVMSLTGQDTRNAGTAGWTSFWLTGQTTTDNAYYDDLYVLDGSGSSPYQDFLGDVRVASHYPNGAGSNNGSTPSTGSDRSLTVDEAIGNADTDYNTLPAGGSAKDTFAMQSLVAAGTAIMAFQTCITAKKTDAGSGSLCPVIRHGSTDYEGLSVAQSTSYVCYHQPYVANPGTSAQMTESDFNALEVGYKRTA